MENELILSKISWDVENGKFFNKYFWVEDKIIYVPCIDIDHFEDLKNDKSNLKNIYENIYEFKFKAIKKFSNEFSKDCYHYLIELASGHMMFHFNWGKEYKEYLQVGKDYWGYGKLCSCGDPSLENQNISPKIINKIIKKASIKNIFINAFPFSFAKVIQQEEEKCYYGNNYLGQMGYPFDYNKFLTNVKKTHWIKKETATTKFISDLECIFFNLHLHNY